MVRTVVAMAALMAVTWPACGGSGGGRETADLPVAFPDGVAPDVGSQDPGGSGSDADSRDVSGDPGGGTDTGSGDPGSPTDPGAVDPGSDPGTPDPGPVDPGPPPCQLSEEQCFGPPIADGSTAGTPFSVSRQLLYLNGQRWNPNNEDAGNNDDLSSSYCRDGGPDQFFRVYLMAGELLSIQLVSPRELDMNVKVYRGIQGDETDALMGCKDDDGQISLDFGSGMNTYDLETYPFVPAADDWYTVVVDGATQDDLAQYLLEMSLLNCSDPDCCCP